MRASHKGDALRTRTENNLCNDYMLPFSGFQFKSPSQTGN